MLRARGGAAAGGTPSGHNIRCNVPCFSSVENLDSHGSLLRDSNGSLLRDSNGSLLLESSS